MARKRSDQGATLTPDVAPSVSPLDASRERPDCLTCPLKECRAKISHARSDMGGGVTIHYYTCMTCGAGNSKQDPPEGEAVPLEA